MIKGLMISADAPRRLRMNQDASEGENSHNS